MDKASLKRKFWDRLLSLNERLLLHAFMFLSVPGWVVAISWVFAKRFALADIFTHTMLHVTVASFLLMLLVTGIAWLRSGSDRGRCWKRRLALFAIPMPLLLFVVQPWQLLNLASQPTNSGRSTKILVWNMYLMNYDIKAITALVDKHDPDILVLIECNPEVGDQLSSLREAYPNVLWGVSWRSQSLAVFTKLQDTQMQLLDVEGMNTASVRFKPNGSDKVHQLYAAHTLSPQWPGNRVAIRNKQLARLAEFTRNGQDEPQIVMGDLNTSPWSPSFQGLLDDGLLIDSRAYRGYYSSWPSFFYDLGIPIDHALVNQHVNIVHRCVLDEGSGSDHRPIILELQ